MIVGAGANIAVQVGEDGVVVVDTGDGRATDKVLAAIEAARAGQGDPLGDQHADRARSHRRQRAHLAKAGRTVNGNLAAIVAHENAAARMVAARVPDTARPFNTYFEASRDFPFNGEPVVLYHDAVGVRMTRARW